MWPTAEFIAGMLVVFLTLWDAFETVILPRTVARRIRLTRLIARTFWLPWAVMAHMPIKRELRESFLGLYGPLLLILLLVVWATGLIFGFSLLHQALSEGDPAGSSAFTTSLYFSGSTFFTLGLGDVAPTGSFSRVVTVIEAGIGFGFLAMVIGYLPVFYQAFSRREVAISLLDARAGSPPTAAQLILRSADGSLDELLLRWESWSADLLETHLSYPVLAYFRSQHENQSWLAALVVILDTSALLMTGLEGISAHQSRFTYAIARHALVDLSQVFFAQPSEPVPPRLSGDGFAILANILDSSGKRFTDQATAEAVLTSLRQDYEPLAYALGQRLQLELPPWLPSEQSLDDWQKSPWGPPPPVVG